MKKFLYRFENCTVGKRFSGIIFIMINTQNHYKSAISKLCAHAVQNIFI